VPLRRLEEGAQGHDPRRVGSDVEQNAVHGSDAAATARAEIAFFFPGPELPGGDGGRVSVA